MGCKASSSFLEKRAKKRLLLGRALPDNSATATQKSFASFLQKEDLPKRDMYFP
jgi:hypothetical protein